MLEVSNFHTFYWDEHIAEFFTKSSNLKVAFVQDKFSKCSIFIYLSLINNFSYIHFYKTIS